jgi:hypothetical protein
MQIRIPAPPKLAHAPHRPTLRAALVAAPLALGAALVAGWWLNRRMGAKGGDAWLRRMVRSRELDPSKHEVLAFIRKALLGLRRHSVRRLLGAPTATGDEGVIVESPGRRQERVAEAWYYRMGDSAEVGREGAALVVEFDDKGRAANARFLARQHP